MHGTLDDGRSPVGHGATAITGAPADLHLGVVALCGLVALVDGFDTQSIALAAPDIARRWGMPIGAFGPVFGAGLLGGLFGALAFGMLADRFGRKRLLIGAVVLFGLLTLLTAFISDPKSLLLLRLLTGLGLGGALPCAIALASESGPPRLRATLVTTMFCGFPLGAVLGSIGSAFLLPAYGWPSLFLIGGALPLLLVPLLALFMPDVRRGAIAAEASATRMGVGQLFAGGRGRVTLLLWAAFFCSLLLAYFLVNWIPLMADRAGVSRRASLLGVAALNTGGVLGCLIVGRLADRFGRVRVVGAAFLTGAVAVALLGRGGSSDAWLLCFALLAGFFSIGAQMATVALGAGVYDARVRATGIGWSMGVGRIGALLGPVIGGMLLTAGVGTPALFACAGVVSALAALAVLAMGVGAGLPEARD